MNGTSVNQQWLSEAEIEKHRLRKHQKYKIQGNNNICEILYSETVEVWLKSNQRNLNKWKKHAGNGSKD